MFPEVLPEISDSDLEHFFQIMLSQYGMDFRGYATSSLKRRLGTVIKRYGLTGMAVLNQRLVTNPDYIDYFINEITVSTTELFRDPSAWIALRSQGLPLVQHRPQLRIWHVGASTGEEVLSMAILLKETGLYEKAEIFATDIDRRSLEQARRAVYPLRVYKGYEQNFIQVFPHLSLEKYAHVEVNQVFFDPSLLDRVRFLQHNIVTEGTFGEFEVILCRNLLIYFTPALQNQVVTRLVDSLTEGGLLMIGTKESLFWCESARRLSPVNEVERIYRKRSSP
ncbi:MAG: protein-glutamate O-methyltransferase CheR [Bacteroidia bacterium]|nr:protein-glutamate O-methyltransferase CheR [Bacteroidia bacterium]MDW8236026.1 protein-glutamate O-methyltransferase CheR [Bacteroidia bacterium]